MAGIIIPIVDVATQPKPKAGKILLGTDANGNLTTKSSDGSVAPVGSGGGLIDITYSELTTKINDKSLTPGQYYLLTDFQTIYDQPDFNSNKKPKSPGEISTKTSDIEALILLAVSTDNISISVISPSYPGDTIKYDYTFNQTEIKGASAKGRITERIDDANNRTDYDHRTVLFKRYRSSSIMGIYDSYFDNGTDYQELLTFGESSANNYIGNSVFLTQDNHGFLLPNNVFGYEFASNIIGDFSHNNTIGLNINLVPSAYFNKMGNYFQNNLIGIGFSSNQFQNFTQNNIILRFMQDNQFGNFVYSNTIGDYFQGNQIGNYFRSNVIGQDFINNSIQNNFEFNKIGTNGGYEYTVGEANFHDNNIIYGFSNNTLDADFQFNTIKSTITGWEFTYDHKWGSSSWLFLYGSIPCDLCKGGGDWELALYVYDILSGDGISAYHLSY